MKSKESANIVIKYLLKKKTKSKGTVKHTMANLQKCKHAEIWVK